MPSRVNWVPRFHDKVPSMIGGAAILYSDLSDFDNMISKKIPKFRIVMMCGLITWGYLIYVGGDAIGIYEPYLNLRGDGLKLA